MRKCKKVQNVMHCLTGKEWGAGRSSFRTMYVVLIQSVISGVKYLSINNLKYYLSSFGGYLYFTLLFIFLTTFTCTSLHS